MRPYYVAGLAFALLAPLVLAPASAQPYGSGMVVARKNGQVLRAAPSGKVTTIGDYSPGLIYAITWDVDNRHLLAGCGSFQLGTGWGYVLRIDPVSGQATTLIPTTGCVGTIELDQNGDYLLACTPPNAGGAGAVIRVMRNTTRMVTIRGGFNGLLAMFQERSTGDWLGGDTVDVLHRFSPDWSKVVLSVPNKFGYVYSMAQDPHNLDVYVGSAALHRFDPASNKTATIDLKLPSHVGARGVAVDRSPGPGGGVLYVTDGNGTASHVYTYDRSGRRLATVATLPDRVTDAVFDRSRNLGTIQYTPPNDRLVCLSFPGEGGKPYALALSLTGYHQGSSLPDGRVIPLTFDFLVGLTARGPVPPFLTGNHGVLSPRGEAVARLDLNPLGVSARGIRLWAVAVVLDPQAPFGISTISQPILVMGE